MTQRCIIHREISIDTGHRVPDHGSKCRNPHGHRYTIIATCEGPVIEESGNEENGMVVDFGNLKTYMMDWLDAVFDHGFVVYKGDTAMMNMFFPGEDHDEVFTKFDAEWKTQQTRYVNLMNSQTLGPASAMNLPRTCVSEQDPDGMKVIPVDYIPTAENLAKAMFDLLRQPLAEHFGDDVIKLVNIKLYETPNGSCEYPGTRY